MSTTSTGSSHSHHSLFRAAAVALVVSAALVAAQSGPALADGPSDQQDAYISSLLAKHAASTPYSQQDDYVRTLVFWHENPDWILG